MTTARSKKKPQTVAAIVRASARRLDQAGLVFAHGTEDPIAEAAFLAGEVIGFHPDDFGAQAAAVVTDDQAARIAALVETRIRSRKPAAYLVNKIYMRGLPFYVDERVIVPRSFIGELLDSDFSAEAGALAGDPAGLGRVLDLCTGSGCLAVLAAHAFPNAAIDAVDLSQDALAVAARNVADHGLTKRITLLQGDLFEPLGTGRYDFIITNPPYVDKHGMASLPRECRFEPAMAFDGGGDGLDLVRRIIDGAAAHLSPRGGLLCEIGRGRDALEAAYPQLPFLWLVTETSEGEVFWVTKDDLE